MNVAATAKTEAVMGASMRAPSDDESIQSAPAAAHEPPPALVLADIPAVYTEREERANTWTHAVGIPLALGMTAALLSRATGFFQTFSAVAFGFGMVAVLPHQPATTPSATRFSSAACACWTTHPST